MPKKKNERWCGEIESVVGSSIGLENGLLLVHTSRKPSGSERQQNYLPATLPTWPKGYTAGLIVAAPAVGRKWVMLRGLYSPALPASSLRDFSLEKG